ncbi:MAG: ABC transporter ATP-binding protein [Pirellulaceae bacterium]|nr:ABC transporter ATP-binding protein [Pirellulaceae bacterium]
MIELKQVAIRSGSFSLNSVSFRVEAGQYAVLMGKTGMGKTTILEAICGLRRVASGSILIRSTDVTRWSPSDRQIGYVPQDLALFPTLNVREHFEFALRLRQASTMELKLRTAELSEVLGVSHLLERRIQGLSGGEAQRVALGRALAARPAVLLLDEPLSALDQATRNEMHEWLLKVKQATGVTTLHVTHNLEEAEALADRRLVLDKGTIVEQS